MESNINDSTALLASIRKEFYALRNGLIADTLRKGGMEQKYIFGLQLPQIKDIALRVKEETGDGAEAIARDLWSDRECREARLLALHLANPDKTDEEEAMSMADDIRTREEADILAFRLVRHMPQAAEIAARLETCEGELQRYAAEAVRRFI